MGARRWLRGRRAHHRVQFATIGAVVVGVLLSGSFLRATPDHAASFIPAGDPRHESPAPANSPTPEPASAAVNRPEPLGKLLLRRDLPRNEITRVSAESLSGQAMRVTVDYGYAGDYGTQDVFLHAAALQRYLHGQGLKNRVPGTGFPGEAVNVGNGRVTLTITRVVEGDVSTSTSVRVCLVSIPKRSAFLCQNFAHTKDWD